MGASVQLCISHHLAPHVALVKTASQKIVVSVGLSVTRLSVKKEQMPRNPERVLVWPATVRMDARKLYFATSLYEYLSYATVPLPVRNRATCTLDTS